MAYDARTGGRGRGFVIALAALASLVFLVGRHLLQGPTGRAADAGAANAASHPKAQKPVRPTPEAEPQHPAPARSGVGLFGLWVGIFGAFLGLTIQTLVNCAIASDACFTGRMPSNMAPASAVWWILLMTTLIALALGMLAFLFAYASWRQVREEGDLEKIDGKHNELLEIGEGRTRFMAMAGMATSAMLLATILFHGMAVLGSPFCRIIA